MVSVSGTLDGRQVKAEIHGPNDVRGDSELVTRAATLIRTGARVYFHPLGGGQASFDDEPIAAATLAESLDAGTAEFEGLELDAPADAVL